VREFSLGLPNGDHRLRLEPTGRNGPQSGADLSIVDVPPRPAYFPIVPECRLRPATRAKRQALSLPWEVTMHPVAGALSETVHTGHLGEPVAPHV